MSAGLKLQGQFKFDLYDKHGSLLKTSNYINNFITQSGLSYPLHFAFADCFRFLSVGSGDVGNSIVPENETTGLQIPDPEFSYIGSRENFLNASSSNYSNSSCGYRFSQDNILELYRGWSLPNNLPGDEGVFQNDGHFKEFMVSPGRPYVEVYDSQNQDTKYLCSCNESFNGQQGKDCSTIPEYYNFISRKENGRLKICDATKAFARVLHDLQYVSGSRLNVTYKLTISINTGLRIQEMNNSHSFPTNNLQGKTNLIQGITQPGLKLINDGEIDPPYAPSNAYRLQSWDYDCPYDGGCKYYQFNQEYGESFIPAHGIPLEPCVHYYRSNRSPRSANSIDNIVHYVSEDNIQFLVSENGGPLENNKTGQLAPWNKDSQIVVDVINSGIKKYKNYNKFTINNSAYWFSNPMEYDIRTKNYSIIANKDNILNQEIFSKENYQFLDIGNVSTSYSKNGNKRTRSVNSNFTFRDYPFITKFYIKSFISSYRDIPYAQTNGGNGDTGKLVPFLDSIFSGSGENAVFIPKIITGIKEYDNLNNTGAFISGANSNDYFYLTSEQQSLYPILFNTLKWSADCPDNVNGC